MCETADRPAFTFCPICQIPLQAITILPEVHVSQCMAIGEDISHEECPRGVHCLSTDVFHYRDFSHKLLAAYRSSADFVPPDMCVQPTHKKRKSTPTRTPRKQKTPQKAYSINKCPSESDSDCEPLVPLKKPCRKLTYDEKTQNSKTDLVQNLSSKTKKSVSLEQANLNLNVTTNTIPNKKNFKTQKSELPCNMLSDNSDLNTLEECSEISSAISIPKITNENGSPPTNKYLPSNTESSKTINKHSLHSDAKKISEMSKLPVCLVRRIELDEITSVTLLHRSKELEEVNELNYDQGCSTDFNDIVPGSMLDKERSTPMNLLRTCSSVCNHSASVSSEAVVSSGKEEDEKGNGYDSPSSPEVVIPSRTSKASKKANLFLSSSSDSDLPLAVLCKDKNTDQVNKEDVKDTASTRCTKSGRVLRFLKKSPVHNNHLSSSGSDLNACSDKDSDSGKSTGSKNSSTNSIVKGKEIAGKVLRPPKKAPIYLNGQSLKSKLNSEINGLSDKDSDSGKSSGSKDSSFIPSEKYSSSQHTDSAFSAESSDNLMSSASTTYTSSEDYTGGYKSSDPSYAGESDSSKSYSKIRNIKENRKSPQKHKYSCKTLSDGSSSDISQKEKILFGGSKKAPSVKMKTDSSPTPQTENIYITCQNKAKEEWQSVLSKMRSSCFPSDLKIDSEDSLTVASSCSSSDTSRSSITLPTRQCPFYKRIPDTPFAVDAFQYWNIPGVRVYFLSHFHSDHYIGLKKSFTHPIYCSKITASLVRMQLRVEEKWLRILDLNEPQMICGVEVTALDANHCPGSMMFLFVLNNGQNYLHVGDFRASKSMTSYPSLQRISISKLFLDTTYCSPQYCFPTQEEVISKVINIVREQVKTKPRTLVVCGSYTIGKEKVFLGIAEALNWRVWARPNKQRIFTCLNDKRINSRLSQDPRTANVHVLPMASLQIMPLQQHLNSCSGSFTHVLGFKPTGWELSGKSQDFKITCRDNITIYGVPYSEHSSFTELRDFVRFVEPHEVVPTVNVGSAACRAKMSKHFSDWLRPQVSEKPQAKVSQYFTKTNVS